MEYRVLNLGDRAITFEFGSSISRRVSHHVLGVHAQLKEKIAQDDTLGIIESVPTFRSLTLHFDPIQILPSEIEELVAPYIKEGKAELGQVSHWSFPVCYAREFAPDLEDVAKSTGLSVEEVIKLHMKETYDVFMLGFLPGFAFMGSLDEKLHLPRRTQPRTDIFHHPPAIADQLTAVYPSESPGGWHLIGRMPIDLFDSRRKEAVLLKAGDTVGFHSITQDEYQKISSAIAAGEYECSHECKIKEVA